MSIIKNIGEVTKAMRIESQQLESHTQANKHLYPADAGRLKKPSILWRECGTPDILISDLCPARQTI